MPLKFLFSFESFYLLQSVPLDNRTRKKHAAHSSMQSILFLVTLLIKIVFFPCKISLFYNKKPKQKSLLSLNSIAHVTAYTSRTQYSRTKKKKSFIRNACNFQIQVNSKNGHNERFKIYAKKNLSNDNERVITLTNLLYINN